MDELSFEIGKNIRKYRKLKGLTGERRFSLDKPVDLIEYFGVTANDIISVPFSTEKRTRESNIYLQEVNELLEHCTDNQLAVVLNILKESVPFLKE
ncbi:hypothetical protein N510_001549 [Firmicutes bacterium ASF500]|nr:hypothetical protein N510_001549 [Firmicutes bacterium ASF500]